MIRRIPQVMALLCAALLIAGAIWRPARVQAQANGNAEAVYTYVALWGVPRAQWGDIEKFFKDAQPALNKLIADGTIVGWGNGRNWTHDDSGMTHANWVTATSFEKIKHALDAIRDALPQPAAFSTSKHMDEMLRVPIHSARPGASGTGMLWVASYQVKPDQTEEFERLFENDIKPLFDEELSAGTILSYSLNFEAIHTGPASTVSIAYILPNAAAIDRFQAALDSYGANHPETGPAMQATMDFTAHRDYVYELIHFAQK